MKWPLNLPVLVFVVLGTACFHAQGDAGALVKVMRLDFATLDSTIWSIRRKVERGQTKPRVYDCLVKQDYSRFTDLWANHVASKLTENEISSAFKFYSGPVGLKYTEYGLVNAHNEFTGSLAEKLPVFTKSEEAALLKFAQSSLGVKLIEEHVLSNPYPESVAKLQEQIVTACDE